MSARTLERQPIGARARAAWRAFRGEQPQVAALPDSSPRSGGRRGKGHPQLVTSYAGYIYGPDRNTEFQGRKKYERYRDMLRDPIVQSTRLLIDGPILSASWEIESESDELREFATEQLFANPHEDALPWRDYLYHAQLAVWFGNYLFERIWYMTPDRRDGLYMSPRPPDSIYLWVLRGRRIARVQQYFYDDDARAVYQWIDGDDLVHFTWDQEANDVEGQSVLRACHRDMVSKWEARDSRDIMIERAQGILLGNPTENATVLGGHDNLMTTLRDFTNHEQLWAVADPGYKIDFLQTASTGIQQAQGAVEYSDRVIQQRLLLTFMAQGMLPSGSRAVAETQEGPFWNVLGGWADRIKEKTSAEWLAPLIRDNFGEAAVKEVSLTWSNLKSRDAEEEIAAILGAVEKIPALQGNRKLQARVLEQIGMPDDVVQAQIDGEDIASAPARGSDRGPAADDAMGARFGGEPLGGWTVDSSSPRAAAGRLVRLPRGAERYVAFEALAVAWDDAEAEARAILEQLRARLIPALQERVQGYTGDPRDGKALTAYLERYKAAWTDEARRKIVGLGVSEFGRGRADVAEELARQPRPPTSSKARLIARKQADVAAPSAAGTSKAAIDSIVGRGLDEYRAGLIREAVTEAVGQAANSGSVTNLAAVRDRMTALSQNAVTGSIRNGISRGYNSGRLNEAVKGGAGYATFSTLLEDGQTCDACAGHENEVVLVGSAEFESLQPPYVDCYSTLSASGRNRCRCIFVYSGVDPVAFEEAA